MRTLSVVIPAYEDAVRLKRNLLRLREIKRREYSALEVIVSVRASADDTLAVAGSFADKVVETEGKVSESRNDGAVAATGEVLIFLDADCVPDFGTLPAIAAAVRTETVGTCSSFPNPFGLRSLVAIAFQNSLRALHILKGSGLLFCHRSLFFDKGIRYDPKLNIGEHQDFLLRAVKDGGARYVYLRIRKGFEVDVSRYERFGYTRTFCFWLLFSIYSTFFGRSVSEEFGRLYWNKKERVSYGKMFGPPVRALRGRAATVVGVLVFGAGALYVIAIFLS